MTCRAPIFISLNGNNCLVVGGGEYAADAVDFFMQFGAKVTVISPDLCARLAALDEVGAIRYIPRRFFRGDAATAYLCVAASGDRTTNIAVSVECKARHIPVNVQDPAEYGTFDIPRVWTDGGLTVGMQAQDEKALDALCRALDSHLPALWKESQSPET